MRSKRRESLLQHTSIPVPEAQRKALTVTPGSGNSLFNEEILGEVVAQVQRSSLISSNLAVSRSLGRGRSRSSSSSPLVDPAASVLRVLASRTASALPPHLALVDASVSGVVRGRLFFQTFGFQEVGAIPYLTLSGGCLSLHWQAWRVRDVDPWVVEVLREGYRIPFLRSPPLSDVPIPMPSYNPLSTKGVALGEVTQALIAKGAVELAPLPSPGFYSRLFLVWKTSGSWRPVIDLSILNLFVDVSHFRMETIQSVLLSVCQGDWMASIDLKEAYLQVPVHPESRLFLRFVTNGQVYQFTALCFGLSTAPQVFFRVMAPVSVILHSWGIRMRRYLDDWLVQSSSRKSLLQDLHVVLNLCRELGIVINLVKSNLEPSQAVQYLGVMIDAQSFVASPSAGSRRQAKVNSWQISVLRPSFSQYLALAARHAVLTVPSHSRGSAPHEAAPALFPPVLGSSGSVDPDPLVSGLPPGSEVVAALAPPL